MTDATTIDLGCYDDRLTPDEISFKRRIKPSSEIQRAALCAALRTGKRFGTNIGAGRFNVVLTAYRLNKNGQPYGHARVADVRTNLTESEAVAALDAIR